MKIHLYDHRRFRCVVGPVADLCACSQAGPAAGQSRARICASANSSPVVSGIYTNGNPFYVCKGNAQGEGERGGYNLEPSWSNACIVGWGGKELPVNLFECLCNP